MKKFFETLNTIIPLSSDRIKVDTKCTGPVLSYASLPVLGICFVDVNTGWAAGGYGKILHTKNGGQTWSIQYSGPPGLYLMAIHFPDKKNGWAVGRGNVILHTENEGQSWKPQYGIPLTCLEQIHYQKNGWVRGWGNNKSKISKMSGLEGVYFLNSLEGWAVGKGVVLSTNNGGDHWTLVENKSDLPLFGVHFLDNYRGWIGGSNGIILSNQYGLQNTGITSAIFKIHFIHRGYGWAAGEKGIILKTYNEGKKWEQQNSGTDKTLYSIYFVNSYRGWAAGEGGIILTTDNGGKNWRKQKSNTSETLYDVCFVDINNGWIGGNNGKILHTNDGGKSWYHQNSKIPDLFRGIKVVPDKFRKFLLDFKILKHEDTLDDIEQKITGCKQLISIEPENSIFLYDLAELYKIRGLVTEVIDTYIKIAHIHRNSFEDEKALQICYRIIQLDPENMSAREILIEIYREKSDIKRMVEQFFTLSHIYSRHGKPREALEYFEKGLEADPHNLKARLELAIMNIKQNNIEEGINQYKKVAKSFQEEGETTKAIDTYKRITLLQPEDTETYMELGRLYKKTGQAEEAKRVYTSILKYDNKNTVAMREFGLICRDMGEIDASLLAFRKIMEIENLITEDYEILGKLYEKRGEEGEAIKQYHKAVEEYRKNKDYKKALDICYLILKLDFKDSKALRMKKELISLESQEIFEIDYEEENLY